MVAHGDHDHRDVGRRTGNERRRQLDVLGVVRVDVHCIAMLTHDRPVSSEGHDAQASSHALAASFTSVSRSPAGSGVRTIVRSAKARRAAYHAGLRRPSTSTTDQLTAGQQSLSCHQIVPEHRSWRLRKCPTPTVTASAWLSWVR